MKKIILASLLAAVGAANAGTITLDDFTVASSVVDTTANAVAATSGAVAISAGTRTTTVNLLAPTGSFLNNSDAAVASIGGGLLSMNNGTGNINGGSNSEINLAYNLNAGLTSGLNAITYAQVSMNVIFADPGQPSGAGLPSGSIGAQTRAATTGGSMIWTLSPSLLTTGGSFAIQFLGNPGWDMSASLLSIQYTCASAGLPGTGQTLASNSGLFGSSNNADSCTPTKVPLPGTVALLGIGMLGVAAARRAKRA
jgi:hypothetical protein